MGDFGGIGGNGLLSKATGFIPLCENLGRIDGCREHDALDMGRKSEQCFFPVLSALFVIDVMDLVEYHCGQFVHGYLETQAGVLELLVCCWLVLKKEVVHQNFGGHEEHLGSGIGFNVSRQKTETDVGIGLCELEIFLVGKRLDGTGIDDFFALTGPVLYGEFRGECFSGAGVCGYQNMLVLENALDGVFLEIAERIGVVGKFGEVGLIPFFGADYDHFYCWWLVVRVSGYRLVECGYRLILGSIIRQRKLCLDIKTRNGSIL